MNWRGYRRKVLVALLEVLICNYLDRPIEIIKSLSQDVLYLDIQYGIKARSFTDWAKLSVGKTGRKNELKLLLDKVRKKGKKIGRKEGRNKNKEGKQIKRRRNKGKSSKLSSPSAQTIFSFCSNCLLLLLKLSSPPAQTIFSFCSNYLLLLLKLSSPSTQTIFSFCSNYLLLLLKLSSLSAQTIFSFCSNYLLLLLKLSCLSAQTIFSFCSNTCSTSGTCCAVRFLPTSDNDQYPLSRYTTVTTSQYFFSLSLSMAK
jgi:hypothetical protein